MQKSLEIEQSYRLPIGYLLLFCFLFTLPFKILAHKHERVNAPIQNESGLLQFIANKGQWRDQVHYKVPMNNGSIFMEGNRFTFLQYDGEGLRNFYEYRHGVHEEDLILKSHVYSMEFVGANTVVPEGASSFKHYYNYFTGKNPDKWASKVPSYAALHYNDLYSGVDLEILASDAGHLKYQFRVAPNVNPNQITIAYSGLDEIWLEGEELHYKSTVHEVRETNLMAYQNINGKQVEVDCHFVLDGNEVRFELGAQYNPNYELVIDPDLIFSSYTGSFADNFGFTATYDEAGNLYAGGIARADGYPATPGAIQDTFAGGVIQGQFLQGFNADISISKFNADGTQLLYSTYLGGSVNDQPHSLIVSDSNELYIFGRSNSLDYPVTANAFDTTNNGGMDIVVSKINIDGTQLLGSTYVGGSSNDGVNVSPAPFNYGANFDLKYNYADDSRGEILLDNDGGVYVAAASQSADFPLISGTNNTIPGTYGGAQDACIFELSSNLDTLVWSTYIGGAGNDAAYSMAFDDSSNLYLCGGTNSTNFPISPNGIDPSFNGGVDGFVIKINPSRDTILNSTFYGTPSYDQTYFIDIDGDANVYVLGQTEGVLTSTPNTYSNPNSGIFVLGLTTNLDTLRFQTTIGAGNNLPLISPTAFLVDDVCKSIYLCGWGGVDLGTGSVAGLPVTPDAFVSTSDGDDFYLMVLSEDAQSLEYATFMGGQIGSRGEHVDGGTSRFDKSGVVYQAVCAGCGGSSAFPTTPGVVSNTNNSTNCNLAGFKFNINFLESTVNINTQDGCIPLEIELEVNNPNADYIFWDMGDGTTFIDSTEFDYTYTTAGNFDIMLISIDSTTCPNTVFIDTVITEVLAIDDQVNANFTVSDDSNCDSLTVNFQNNSSMANSYQWDFGDGTISTLANPVHVYRDSGTYEIVLIARNVNTCNAVDSSTYILEYLPLVRAEVAASDTTDCLPFSVEFFNQTGMGDSLYWTFSNGFSSRADTFNYLFDQRGEFDVTLVVVDSNTCNISDTAFQRITVLNDTVVAALDTTVLVQNCDSLLVQFTNNSFQANAYQWIFDDGTTSSATNPLHAYTSSGIYDVQLIAFNDSTCNQSDTARVQLELEVRLRSSLSLSDTLACVPTEIVFENQTPGLDTLWWTFSNGFSTSADSFSQSFAQTGLVNVLLVGVDSSSCNIVDSVQSQVRLIDDSVFAEFDTILTAAICDSLVLDFDNNSLNATSYTWLFSDSTSSNLFEPRKIFNDTGVFEITLIASNQSTCNVNDTAFAKAYAQAPVLAGFNVPGECYPFEALVENASINATGYQWYFENQDYGNDTLPNEIYLEEEGLFNLELIATNPNTCNKRDSITQPVYAYGYPIAAFETDTNVYPIFSDIRFVNRSEGAVVYNWEFDDGFTSEEISPERYYELEGFYEPCLTATNEYDCAAQYCKDIELTFRGVVDIPNAFSPNGDGSNDILYVKGFGVDYLELKIYNRWGELVFESTSLENGWDGTYKGKAQEKEVYTYTLKAWFRNGTETDLQKGNITLLR